MILFWVGTSRILKVLEARWMVADYLALVVGELIDKLGHIADVLAVQIFADFQNVFRLDDLGELVDIFWF